MPSKLLQILALDTVTLINITASSTGPLKFSQPCNVLSLRLNILFLKGPAHIIPLNFQSALIMIKCYTYSGQTALYSTSVCLCIDMSAATQEFPNPGPVE